MSDYEIGTLVILSILVIILIAMFIRLGGITNRFKGKNEYERMVRAVELIKNKNVDVDYLKKSDSLITYNIGTPKIENKLTLEEYIFLKVVLL